MIIYKITCKLNGKSYVGKTARSLKVRITEIVVDVDSQVVAVWLMHLLKVPTLEAWMD